MPPDRIRQDAERFKKIIKGKIKEDIKKYISRSRIDYRKGQKQVSIPVDTLDLPHFRYGKNQGGVEKRIRNKMLHRYMRSIFRTNSPHAKIFALTKS